MKIGSGTTLPRLALLVGDVLRRAGIRAVLTGGACASVHTGGRTTSVDADFVLTGEVDRSALDAALLPLGFLRAGDRYVHEASAFYVEFPAGPLAIGNDDRIRPVERVSGNIRCLTLSATDSCRDRLAAYYHWNDRQSLSIAIEIALRNRLRWEAIRRWSAAEGFTASYDEFVEAVREKREMLRKK